MYLCWRTTKSESLEELILEYILLGQQDRDRKVCLKKVTSKSLFKLMFHTKHRWLRQLSNFLPLPIARVLAILKEKIYVKFHQDHQSSAKSKKESRKKRKFNLSDFQTLSRFSSREA